MASPICFRCVHFVQYQPLHFLKPGVCNWKGDVPPWLDYHANGDRRDIYVARRDITSSGPHIITECPCFKEKEEEYE